MNNEDIEQTISSRDDFLMLDYIIEGYGFKNDEEFINLSGMMPKQDFLKQREEENNKLNNVFYYIEQNFSSEQAEELLKKFHIHQFKFGQFKAKNKLEINIFVESQYEKEMTEVSRELFFQTQLKLIDKIQEKFKLNIIKTMSQEEILKQHAQISNKMCVNPEVRLVYRDDVPKKRLLKRKFK